MNKKLDQESLKILYQLDCDSTISLTKLATNINSSIGNVRYRLTSLIDEGIITKFHTVVDTGTIGHQQYKVYLKLNTIDNNIHEKFINFVNSKEAIVWFNCLEGEYDYGFAIRNPSIFLAKEIIDELNDKIGDHINHYIFGTNIKIEYFSRDYLNNNKKRALKKSILTRGAIKDPIKLDEISIKIINILRLDSRITASEISRLLKEQNETNISCSREAVSNAIKKLEKSHIITGYKIFIDYEKLNITAYKVLVNFNNSISGDVEKFINKARQDPNVVLVIKSIGKWDVEFTIEVEKIGQLREVLSRITEGHEGLIKNYTSLLITKNATWRSCVKLN